MSHNDPSQLFDLPANTLNHIASQVLGTHALSFGALSVKRIGRSFGSGTLGVFRVTGDAQTSTGTQSWSAVAKILTPSVSRFEGDNVDDTPVEVEVYRSGVFDQLCGGVRAAHCYAIDSHNNLQYLWLEDLSGAPQAPWIEPYFIQAARNVGQFNAHWSEDTLPEWQWLSNVSFDQYKEPKMQTQLDELSTRQNEPIISSVATPEVMRRVGEFWQQSNVIFAKAETVTKGISHADCHPKNLFPMHNEQGEPFTIVIDWFHVGLGPLGIDPANLLASPSRWLELTPTQARSLIDPVYEAYLAGIKESGWAGNEMQLRYTYLTALGCESLRLLTHIPAIVDDPKRRERIESTVGYPLEVMAEHWAEMQVFGLDMIDEAMRLTAKL